MVKKLKPLNIGGLEVKIPIVQGGMGVMVSTAALASAVANCGGAGTISSVGLGYGTAENQSDFVKASREGLRREIALSKELTQGVVGVNIMVALSNYDDLVRTAVSERCDFIVSGAGLPLRLPELSEDPAIKLIPIVSSARAAELIIRSWKRRYNRLPDAIVVEGPLAGGHLGFSYEQVSSSSGVDLEQLVVDLLKVVTSYEKDLHARIPVIAAGGVFDGKDAAKFFRLGASGVQIATRFVVTHECPVAQEFKQLYISAKQEDVVIIKSPVGMPGRAVRTGLIDRVLRGEGLPFTCGYQCLKTCDPKTAPYCIAEALFNAFSGDLENAVVFAGSNVSRVDRIVSVKELMEEIVSETVEELDRGAFPLTV